MKIVIGYRPAFCAELLMWSATLIVGSRGSFSCRWREDNGDDVDVSKKRCQFNLTNDELLGVEARLERRSGTNIDGLWSESLRQVEAALSGDRRGGFGVI